VPAVEEILPHAGRGLAASRRIDKQGREAGEMFGARLDGIDPAPLALVEVGRCQQSLMARIPSAGCDLMRKRGERRLDHAGPAGFTARLAARLRALPAQRLERAFLAPPFR